MDHLLWTVTVCLSVLCLPRLSDAGKPNILLMMSDDVGWGDYEVNDPEMATPALTRLAQRGLVLNQSYTLQTCTPTRSALLSGRYSYKIGMQAGKIKGTYLRWLNESVKLLPESLKELGYATHAVGKWHLGFCNWKLTPRYRGFGSFYGFLSGEQGYFTHSGSNNISFDFRDDGRVAWETKGNYSTELHTARVQQIIRDRDNKPFFIYMAYQNAHSPWEAKQRYVDTYCSHVENKMRRIHCAMVAAMDESVGNITKTLEDEGIFNDTIILYLSDNGGPTKYGSINWPMRGGKASFWEGGTRSWTVFSYPRKLKTVNATWSSLVHVTDWYTTFLKAAGGNVTLAREQQDLDGVDHFHHLTKFKPGKRSRMVYNIDDRRDRAAVRIGDMKLLRGKPGSVSRAGWLPPPSMNMSEETVTKNDIPKWQLYNVTADPAERNNLINDTVYATIVRKLKRFLAKEETKLVPFPANLTKVKTGDPKFYSGAWSPGWCCLPSQECATP